MDSFVSPYTGDVCCPIGCATYKAVIRSRDPKTGVYSPFKVEVDGITGRVFRELSRVGFVELEFDLLECKRLYEALREAGVSTGTTDFGEWGHEVQIVRSCEPDCPVFDGPIVGLLTDADGGVTVIAADRAAWWGEGWLEQDLLVSGTAGSVFAQIVQAYRAGWNDDGANIDLGALSDCGDMVDMQYFASDCIPVLDHLIELGDLWVPWVFAGNRFYYGCPDFGLPPLVVGRADWVSCYVPEFRDGYSLATVVKVVADVAEGSDAEVGNVGVYPDGTSGYDDCDPFYGRHGHVINLNFAADQATVDAAARNAWRKRRRTPRLLDGNTGFSQGWQGCVADLIPGRNAHVEGAGHWQKAGQLVEQTLGTVDIRFEDGCETVVAPGFFGAGFDG